jgi:hypothetical protein
MPPPMSSDDHQDSTSNALVPHPGTDLTKTGRRTNAVIARMTRDVLARAESHGISTARYRLGQYVLREPDYLQILDWAEALRKAPEWVLTQLEESRLEPNKLQNWEPIAFFVEDGAIRSLVWDFKRLPVVPESWRLGLLIQTLGLMGKWPKPDSILRPNLPYLKRFHCRHVALSWIDLSAVPGLIELVCSSSNLTALNLTPVPRLTYLDCSHNLLTDLDLTPAPGLTTLRCWENQLTDLDLKPVPGLTVLDCSDNKLTDLDLKPVPGLTTLSCNNNPLTELDLKPVPGLTVLDCARQRNSPTWI